MKFKIGDLVHTEDSCFTYTNEYVICEVVEIDHIHTERIRIKIIGWKSTNYIDELQQDLIEKINEIISNKNIIWIDSYDFELYKRKRKITI